MNVDDWNNLNGGQTIGLYKFEGRVKEATQQAKEAGATSPIAQANQTV